MTVGALIRQDSPARRGWDAIQICSALITGFILPVCILSPKGIQPSIDLWIALSILGIIDIAIQSKTPFETKGELEYNSKKIFKHYKSKWLGPDLIANLSLFLTPINPGLAWLQLVRCSNIFRILNRWENHQWLKPLVLKISRYAIGILLITNWVSNTWLWIGLINPEPSSWIQRAQLNDQSYAKQYLMSIYWSVTTLTSVGYGDIAPETTPEILIAILVMGLGVVLFAFAIGNVVAFISQLDDGRAEYKMEQDGIRRYLAYNGVSPKTLARLRQFSDYLWIQSRGAKPDEILSKLPISVRTEILSEILERSVASVPLFSKSPASLRNRLLMILRPEFYPPGSIILNHDEPGNEIVFLTHGDVQISTDQDISDISEEVLHYKRGDYFGDLSFFLKEKRNSAAIAQTYVEAFLLSRSLFNELSDQDPRLREVMQEMAKSQTQRNQSLLLGGIIL